MAQNGRYHTDFKAKKPEQHDIDYENVSKVFMNHNRFYRKWFLP